MAESYHWYLDVIFQEDGNFTLEIQVLYNLNIIKELVPFKLETVSGFV